MTKTIGKKAVIRILIMAIMIAGLAMTYVFAGDSGTTATKIDSSQSKYTLNEPVDFVLIKQASSVMVWTRSAVTDEQKTEIKEAVRNADSAIKDGTVLNYGTGYDKYLGASDFGLDADSNIGYYKFSTDGTHLTVNVYQKTDSGDYELSSSKVSHIDYGSFGTDKEEGKIVLTKTIENGDGISGTFYFKLLDSSGDQVGALKSISVSDGTADNTVSWDNLPVGEYTIVETDADGNALKAGDKVFGKELVNITNDNVQKVTISAVSQGESVSYDNIKWQNGTSSNLFGSAGRFNCFTFGNLKNIVDIEGNTAAGGDFTNTGGFSSGFKLGNYSSDIALLVKGDVQCQGWISTIGNVVTGGSTFKSSGSSYSITSDYTKDQLESLYAGAEAQSHGGSDFLISSSGSGARIKSDQDLSGFFSDAKTYMESLSKKLASIKANGTIKKESYSSYAKYTLTGTDEDLNVFDLDLSSNSDLSDPNTEISIDCPASSTVIVNIKGTNIKSGNSAWGNSDLSKKTIFNFVDCTSFTMEGSTAFYGSFLAPDADFTVNAYGGNINGNAILNSLTSKGGFECHNYPFSGRLPEDVEITNTFGGSDADITLGATKVMSGRSFRSGDEFTFGLYKGTDTSADPIDTVKTTATSGNSQTVSFDKITYDEAGTYTYTIKEIKPDSGALAGVTYSDREYKVTVTVTKDSSGNLSASAVMDGGTFEPENATFTNTYSAKGSITLSGTKDLTGRDYRTGEKFGFEVYEKDASGNIGSTPVATGTTASDNSGTSADNYFRNIEFTPINYTEAGTHTYVIKEKIPDGVDANNTLNGVTYSDQEFTVTVDVTDNGDGTLKATADYSGISGGKVEFTNCYGAKGEIRLTGTKTMTGRDFSKDESYSFEVQELENGSLQTVANGTSDEGTITFDKIQYTVAGNHTYYITETSTDGNGVTVDKTVKTVYVSVTDNGDGTLSAAVSGGSDSIAFDNTYKSEGKGQIILNKALTGKSLAADAFSFDITETDASGDAVSGGYTATVKNDAGGQINFSNIPYTKAGTYYYRITEETPSGGTKDGITYDTSSIKVTMNVKDNGDGTLTATPSYPSDTTFNNTYDASGKIALEAAKTLTGKTLAADEFSFEVVDSSDKVVATGKNDASGSVKFSDIDYTLSDLDGASSKDFTYTVKEKVPSEKEGGVTYDTKTYQVTVTVTDNGDGTLKVTADKDAKDMTFSNTYKSEGKGEIILNKALTGKDLSAGDFSFTLTQVDKDGNTVSGGYTDTVSNGADGTIDFTRIPYAEAGTYYYEIKENVPSEASDGVKNGVTYDTSTIKVTMNVKDNGGGTLTATPSYPSDTTFTNTYSAKGSITLSGTKDLTGRDYRTGEKFGFEVYEKDASGNIGSTPVATGTTASDNSGTSADNYFRNIEFTPINYTEAGTHTYVIKEKIPDGVDANNTLNGVTYSDQEFTVTVDVTDNGDGTLKATADYSGISGGKVEFTNCYGAKGEIRLTGTKTMTGRDFSKDESYSFEVQELENGSLQTVANGTSDEGTITFDKIQYTVAGNHTYYITETSTDGNGVTVDKTVKTVYVSVTDNGDGTLSAAVSGGSDSIAFDNTYTPYGKITVTKQVLDINGDTPINKTFYVSLFKDSGLKDRVGTVSLDVVDNASASKTFENLDFGTYYIAETDADGNVITKDDIGAYDIQYSTKTVTISQDVPEGSAAVTNYFKEGEEYDYGSVKVTKKVTVDGKGKNTDLTFYAALFSDEACTDRITDVQALKMDGKDSTSVTFLTDKEGNYLSVGTTYYVAETDESGNAITDPEDQLGCTIEQDTKYVTITPDNIEPEAQITNKFTSEEEHYYKKGSNTGTTSTTSTTSRTGDDMHTGLWTLLILAGAAGAASPLVFRRKNEK